MPPMIPKNCDGNSTPDLGKIMRVGVGSSAITWVGTGVLVGGMGVLVGGTGVLVGGTGVLVGGMGVEVG